MVCSWKISPVPCGYSGRAGSRRGVDLRTPRIPLRDGLGARGEIQDFVLRPAVAGPLDEAGAIRISGAREVHQVRGDGCSHRVVAGGGLFPVLDRLRVEE